MFGRPGVELSGRRNALHDRDNLPGVLMRMSDGNRFAASATAGPGLAAAGPDADRREGALPRPGA